MIPPKEFHTFGQAIFSLFFFTSLALCSFAVQFCGEETVKAVQGFPSPRVAASAPRWGLCQH